MTKLALRLFLPLILISLPTLARAADPKMETATFALGCFWGSEEFFRKIPGVMETRVGYEGGKAPNPTYDKVSEGSTGYAETVEIKFDPTKVSYEKLLDLFFKIHDPTTLNRQGNDRGTQYRSAIFANGAQQRAAAEAFRAKVDASGAWKAKTTTEIADAGKFWPAEEDHQKYLAKHPGGYDNHSLRDISFDGKPGGKK